MPPDYNDKNYPPLTENTTQQNIDDTTNTQQDNTIIEETSTDKQPTPEITIVEETPFSQLSSNTDNTVEPLSPPIISTTTLKKTTPDTIHTSIPTINTATSS